jgi:hypothetical protein
VILYGCDTWSLTLIEEHRLRVFENKVLRTIFGPKRDEGKREMRIGYWWESQRERDRWGDQDVGGRTILKLIFWR